MEDYRKIAIELGQTLISKAPETREDVERMLPELKESEDERTRKEIIDYLSTVDDKELIPYESWIAWLEQQGEQPRKVSIWKHWKDGIAGNGEGKLIYLVKVGNTYRLTSCLGFECDYIELSELDKLMHEKQGKTFTKKDVDDAYLKGVCDTKQELEKQGEQKSVDTPKFKVGAWVILTAGELSTTLQIVKVDTNKRLYWFNDSSYLPIVDEECLHLWTIQDAKEGDVLVFKNNINGIIICKSPTYYDTRSYCRLISDNFINKEESGWDSTLLVPATKEQRDTLLKAMADAGYTFDLEKKELKKIEQIQAIDYSDSLPKDNWELIHEFVNKFGRMPKDEDELNVLIEYVLKRQKSVEWSKEVQEEQVSEEFINALGTMLNDGLPDRYLVSEERIKKSAELLFSIARKQLKNEMQEWSEEDEKMLSDIIVFVSGYAMKEVNKEWVNFLKSRLPQKLSNVERNKKNWKPSDAQIKVCKEVYADILSAKGFDLGTINSELNRLEEQLKKLMEE